ncbi:GEVED domain-containing protein [Salinimicrobium sediminilitoris]|uniref:GEVED domain-containing protein n=1 Tax=Salinimicrobium sediminilitoris TaxID=2876715 RepID=UPI001E5E4B7E|nr:GEVED domain-containing protein [Salinimicrobium sediminilitoris]MCC8359311.1 GEVED domain-containing protein [Salinimicrobium sediminilitoris]
MVKNYFLLLLLFFAGLQITAQDKEILGPISQGLSEPSVSAPLSAKELIPAISERKEVNPKNRTANRVVPGKGFPKGIDAALQEEKGAIPLKQAILSFDAANLFHTPTDPTGAAGPNHYVNAYNSGFSVFDKQGNVLLPPTDLSSLGGEFSGERLGDPIVLYDQFADRFLITQFAGCPYDPTRGCPNKNDPTNALLVAISRGPDPVNDGWYTYRFATGTFPDYPKYFVWSDGYYVTTNQDLDDPEITEVVYVLERDKMLQGEAAKHIGFPLPRVRNNGFYSPAALNATGNVPPPPGNMPVIYFQDDSWMGVNVDHLKIWLVNVDWNNLQNSTIRESQEITPTEGLTPFKSTFDGGGFSNLPQPFGSPDLDALQGALMYPTSYRRFDSHNSVVFNFVVDVDPSQAQHAGIRWYELRQTGENQPWSIYQEGTYAPDLNDRWCGSINIDKHGNIGMGFTVVDDNPEAPVLPSLKFTGRFFNDPPNLMTLQEVTLIESTSPSESNRYGDYAHTSIDPVDNETFWYNGEYFRPGSRLNRVGVFKLAPQFTKDVGVTQIISPVSSTLSASENVRVSIRNFGSQPQSNFPVYFQVNEGEIITETFSGTIPSTDQVEFTFSETVDLSNPGEEYEITVGTELEGDMNSVNDTLSARIINLPPKDIGVTSIVHPETASNLGVENIVVTIENFGGESQTNFDVGYSVNGGDVVTETVTEVLEIGAQITYTFNSTYDFSANGKYTIEASTFLEDDSDTNNDGVIETVAQLNCIPVGSSCAFGDGINSFYLEDIVNENIYCDDGYNNFLGISTRLDVNREIFSVGVRSSSSNEFSMWIDFNDNAVFEPEEQLVRSGDITSSSTVTVFEFTLPENAPLGEHILRARAGDVSSRYEGELNDPCSVMEFGTTEDYTVVLVDGIKESELQQGEFIISSSEEDIFELNFTTPYQRPLWLTVHDMLGQKLVEAMIKKGAIGYGYVLDMSYAASGVYLVRIGTREEGKVKRIIVH